MGRVSTVFSNDLALIKELRRAGMDIDTDRYLDACEQKWSVSGGEYCQCGYRLDEDGDCARCDYEDSRVDQERER